MFDKKVIINKPQEIKVIKLGKRNILVLEFDYNLTDDQFETLKKNWNNRKLDGLEIVIFEGGAKINTVLTMD